MLCVMQVGYKMRLFGEDAGAPPTLGCCNCIMPVHYAAHQASCCAAAEVASKECNIFAFPDVYWLSHILLFIRTFSVFKLACDAYACEA